MADETAADDQALYGVWDHLTAEQVAAIFDRLELLARALRRLRGGPVPPELVALAVELRDGDPPLGHLPIVAALAP